LSCFYLSVTDKKGCVVTLRNSSFFANGTAVPFDLPMEPYASSTFVLEAKKSARLHSPALHTASPGICPRALRKEIVSGLSP
jgi:hypothetical protein